MNFTFSENNYFENNTNINGCSPNIYFLPKVKDNSYPEEFYNSIDNYYVNKNNITPTFNEQQIKKPSKDKENKIKLRHSSSKKDKKQEVKSKIRSIGSKLKKEIKKKEKKAKKDKKHKNKKDKEIKKRGRGRKSEKSENNKLGHNKYCEDNMRKKCKHLVMKSLLYFINDNIYRLYNGNIGKGVLIKKLFILNQAQKCNDNVNFNKDFLNKKIGQIFSDNISSRINSFPPFHNKNLINKLMNEKNQMIKNYFTRLFNLGFIQALKHFIGQEQIEILVGLKTLHDFKEEIIQKYDGDGLQYYEALKYYMYNYENIIYKKKSRSKSK